MNRSNDRLALVHPEHTRTDRQRVQQPVLVSVHPRRSDDRSSVKCLLDSLLAFVLGAVEGRFGVGRGVEMGDMDEAGDARVGGDTGEATGARDVNVVERVVPAVAWGTR